MQSNDNDSVVQDGDGGMNEIFRINVPKGKRGSKAAAGPKAAVDSDSLDSAPQLSPEDAEPASAQQQDSIEFSQDDQEPQLTQQHGKSDVMEQHAVDTEQQLSTDQQQESIAAPTATVAAILQVVAAQQQPAAAGLPLPGPLAAVRKEPLCLRVRPLDGATRRLMQSLGCTALLEMPNNK